MRIFTKTNNGLKHLGEGRIYSKSQLKLTEDAIKADIGGADNIDDAIRQSKDIMNRDSNVSATTVTGISKTNSVQNPQRPKMQISQTADTQTKAAVSNMLSKNAGKVDLEVTESKRISEMRKSSIPFTKREMTDFLREI